MLLLNLPLPATAARPTPFVKLERKPEPLINRREPVEPHVPQASRRSKIWELSETLHCSIIGTCLTTSDLRNVLERLEMKGIDSADEHDVHISGVMLAGRPDAGAKLLQKALDRRHAIAIKQFGKAKDENALRSMWREAAQRGDIPGAYWALLTHPSATQGVVKKAFQDVHMLSHLVGAANRADIRRLRQQEEAIAELTEKTERQQRQLRDGFASRDEAIRRLNDALAKRLSGSDSPSSAAPGDDDVALLLKDMETRLSVEIARRERLERRCETLSASLSEKENVIRELQQGQRSLQHELETIEQQLSPSTRPNVTQPEDLIGLAGLTVLYVGGRTHQVPQLKSMVERFSAAFLDHDGGIDHNLALLPSLVSRADIVLFPVDCISHNAMTTIKRLCRQAAKQYRPLRTSSIASLTASLCAYQHAQTAVPAR